MIFFVLFIIVVSFLDTFVQLPIISPYAQSLGAGAFIIGIIVGMYSLSNMFGNVLAGHYIDNIGRKKIMIIGMLIAGLSLFIYAIVTSAQQLLLIRFIHGIGGGLLIPAAFAYLSDYTKGSNRGKTMALSGAAVGLAAIIGPAVGGIVSSLYGIPTLYNGIGILMIVTALLVLFFLPESYKTNSSRELKFRELPQFLKRPGLVNAYLSALALMFTLGIVTYKLPLKLEALGYSSSLTGTLMSSYGVIAIILFILPTNRLSDTYGRMYPMMSGLALIALSCLMLSLASQIPYLYIAMLLFGSGFAFLFPAMTALVIDQTSADERGRAFGLFYAFYSLGVVIGPVLIGALNVSFDLGLLLGFICLLVICTILFFRKDIQTVGY